MFAPPHLYGNFNSNVDQLFLNYPGAMNLKNSIIWIISFLFFFTGNLFLSLAQPIITELNALTPDQVNSFSRFTVTQETPGATEATVNFSYTYDGRSGPTALVYVIPISKDYPKSGIWFGSDPFTVSTGRGVGAVKISYFQDEPNAPITLSTEKIRVLVVSNGGRGVVSDLSFNRKVQWGNANDIKAINSVQSVSLAPDPAAEPELIQRQKEVEAEKLRLERRKLRRVKLECEETQKERLEKRPQFRKWQNCRL